MAPDLGRLANLATARQAGRSRHVVVTPDPLPLVRDLLTGLAGLVHPHGPVDAPGTDAQANHGSSYGLRGRLIQVRSGSPVSVGSSRQVWVDSSVSRRPMLSIMDQWIMVRERSGIVS